MKFLSGLILAAASSGTVWAQCDSDVSVEVERLALDDWQVSYRFDAAFDRFAFLRTGDDYRSARWQVGTPGVSLERMDDVDYLTAETPVEVITIRMSSQDHPVVYDNQSFLDLGGAVARSIRGSFGSARSVTSRLMRLIRHRPRTILLFLRDWVSRYWCMVNRPVQTRDIRSTSFSEPMHFTERPRSRLERGRELSLRIRFQNACLA